MRPCQGLTVVLTGKWNVSRAQKPKANSKVWVPKSQAVFPKKTNLVVAGADGGSQAPKSTELGIEVRDEAWLEGL